MTTTPTRIPGDTFTDEDAADLAEVLGEGSGLFPLVAASLRALRAEVERLTAEHDRAVARVDLGVSVRLDEARTALAAMTAERDEARAEIARLKAENEALGARSCSTCSARFATSVRAVLLDGVTRCGACVLLDHANATIRRLMGVHPAHEVREVAMLCLAEVHTGTGAEASAIVDRVMAERHEKPQSAHVAQKERA